MVIVKILVYENKSEQNQGVFIFLNIDLTSV